MEPSKSAESPLLGDVRQLTAVSRDRAHLLAKLGIFRAKDLLFHFPRAYEEVAPLRRSDEFEPQQRATFVGVVEGIEERFTQSGRHMLGAQVTPDGGGAVRLLWFNQPYRKRDLKAGQRLRAVGVLKSTGLNWEMVQPQISLLEPDDEPDSQKPLPIYPLCEGLKQSHLRRIMRETLPPLIGEVEEVLPEDVRTLLQVSDIHQALHDIHFPNEPPDYEQARRRFKLQELLVLQLAISMQRAEREQGAAAPQCPPSGKIHARILNRLGFSLTPDQTQAIDDIGRDMSRETPMNRLLQGDVGSGKTVVAQYAMLLCVAYQLQAALMAPTEVLARQHAATLEKSLAASRVRVGLLTGSLSRAERSHLLSQLAAGDIDLVVGTQALLSRDVQFQSLGLVTVDEQHKFGVLQRAKLRSDLPGSDLPLQPHYLVLSATPIPRTIAMTAFGDLDVSTIRQKPPGRAAVHTYAATDAELESWWKFVDDKLSSGRQAYVIAPRVEESENEEAASATGVFENLATGRFSNRTVGLLHGRLESQEKERQLKDFAAGLTQVLVATTVVEVGIDVPNATVMTILDADRLGLAQLHQLRGRISRGSHPGYVCAVAARGADTDDNQRLAAFQKSDDGFELAEMDLRLRGPGDLLGTSQSGLPRMKIANLVDDADLVEQARRVAREVLASDPELAAPELQRLRHQTVHRYGDSMQLSDIG